MSDGANSRPRSWIGAVALLILFTSGLFAQDSPFRLKVDVSLIPIDVAVYDASGKPVSGLPADDFVVLEDGEPQPIQHFEPVDAAYNTLLLFDVSGSTENQRPFMIEAANRFLANVRPADSVAIASFDSVVTRLMDWRTRAGASQSIVVPFRRGGTDLYTALSWTAGELDHAPGRKGVVVLTDGMDQRQFAGPLLATEVSEFQRVLQAVEQSHSPFYFVAINLSQFADLPASMPRPKGLERMQTLASQSGGRVLFPRSIYDVSSLYESIARELSASYSLAYASTRPQQDGTYRRISIRLKNASFRVSQSRDGYYADNVVPQEKEKPSVPRITSRTEDAPVLVTPIAQALLSPPDKNEWRFTWDEVPNAIRYEIEIYAPRVEAPVVKAQSRTTQYVVGRAFRYAVVHGEGWSWKLRAQQPDGSWSAWSETRPFNVFITERSPL